MAINLLPVLGAGIGALQQNKIQQATEGTKNFTRPKTIFGKLIGGVTGRTVGFETQEAMKQSTVDSKVYQSLQPQSFNTDPNIRTSFPVTGGVQFGTQAKSRPWLPYAVVAALVAIFYFMRGKKQRRRR